MEWKDVLSRCDHTLLNQVATSEDIRAICDDGLAYGVASVCISPCFVAEASDYLDGRLPVCTVIGFPNGTETVSVKCFEAADAIGAGADELDMVVNLGLVRGGRYREVREEIEQVRRMCGKKILKVIIETSLLTQKEKIEMCRVVSDSGADYIKTSTGFAGGGATFEDVNLIRENIEPHLLIKASGGIASFQDAEAFLQLGAARIGSSRLVRLAKENSVVIKP